MDEPEFPLRFFTKGDEPIPGKSIGYYSSETKLFAAVAEALEEDEWAYLFNSRLCVFLKFNQLDFGWASRLVHHMLSFQLVCKKNFEIWSLIGVNPLRFSLNEFEHFMGLNCDYVDNLENPKVGVTEEMLEFWEQMGVNYEMGPSIDDLMAACKVSRSWSREDRLRFGYLAIYDGLIEAQKTSTATRVSMARLVMDLGAFENYPWGRVAFKKLIWSVEERDLTKTYSIEGFVQVLQVWVYYALPDFAAVFGEPIPNDPTPPLMAYKGSRGRKNVKDNMQKHGCINNYVLKEFDQMFPLWDDDEEDVKIENIVKAMFEQFGRVPWKWTRSHWPLVGVKTSNNVKSENTVDNKKSFDSDEESRKRSRSYVDEDGSMVATMKAHIEICFIKLSTKMMDGLSNCEYQIKLLSKKVEVVERTIEAVKGGPKENVGDYEQVKSNANPVDGKTSNDEEGTSNPDIGVSLKPSPKKKGGKIKKN